MHNQTDDRRHEDRRLENRVRELELKMVTLAADVRICNIKQDKVESALDSRYRELTLGHKAVQVEVETLKAFKDNTTGAYRAVNILLAIMGGAGVLALIRSFLLVPK